MKVKTVVQTFAPQSCKGHSHVLPPFPQLHGGCYVVSLSRVDRGQMGVEAEKTGPVGADVCLNVRGE